MANRYWVGGTATWDAGSGAANRWSTTSGGAAGAATPTAADDVFLDAASGASAITMSGPVCRSFTCTGFTGSLVNGTGGFQIGDGTAGHVVLGSGMTWGANLGVTFISTTGPNNITSNGITFGDDVTFNGVGGSWVLQDTFANAATQLVTVENGTLNTNGMSVTVGKLKGPTAGTATITLGSSTVTVAYSGASPSGPLNFNLGGTLTLNANTSTIVVSDATSTTKGFDGGGKTFNNVTLTGGGSGAVVFTGANTFNILTASTPKTVTFPASTTTTATSFIFANAITIQSSSAGTAATLSQASGSVRLGPLGSVKDSTATGGASFVAILSTNVSGNTGWSFLSSPPGSMFLVFE